MATIAFTYLPSSKELGGRFPSSSPPPFGEVSGARVQNRTVPLLSFPVILLRHDVRSLIQSPCGPPFRPYARPRRLCGVRRRHARARQRPRGRRVGDCVRQAPQACDRQLLRHVDHGRLLQPHDRGREGEALSDRDRREDLRSRQLSEGGRKGKLRHVDRLERPHEPHDRAHGRAAACSRRLGRGARPQLRQRRGDHRARRPSPNSGRSRTCAAGASPS